ncbi:MAG: serine hydrolase [Gemmataceae bacterium]|nr:serine hydrolase [Gemmataceae bacterium]
MILLLLLAQPDYSAAIAALDALAGREAERHLIPALSLGIVADGKTVWSKGWKADDKTVYRVGSVSKLFTDLGLMRLHEAKTLDIDAPISRIDPAFKIADKRAKDITLRHLMAHRSGLVREPARGSYFDETTSDLEATLDSLAPSPLVYGVGARMKYSNAGIALAGHLLGKAAGKGYAEHLRETLLLPLGMESSAFEAAAALRERMPKAVMWTYHGRTFPAPTFEMGIGPGGSLYSTAADQARFLKLILGKGEIDGKRLVKAETLEEMWKPQFTKDKSGAGIGFFVGELDGKRVVGHGGAVYGYSTQLSAMPDHGLGVVACSARDCSNAVTSRLATEALRLFAAAKGKKPLPKIEETTALEDARKWAGRWESGKEAFDLEEQGGRLYHWPAQGGFRAEVRRLGKDLMTDDCIARGLKLEIVGEKLRVGKALFTQRPRLRPPAECPEKWRGLIGEYGPDHLPTIILEKDGKLHLLVEWFFHYPLDEQADGSFLPPDSFGLYHGERVAFTKDKAGRATAMSLGPMTFKRREESRGTFRIKPLKPVAQLRKEAKAATPPDEPGVVFRDADLVDLDPAIKRDIRYATADNFLGEAIYEKPMARLQKPAAEALLRVHKSLAKRGLGLTVFDGYRPWWVTHVFWHATPRELRVFVADPRTGSRHNRGCAVDLTLHDLKTGKPVEMPGGYDEMSDRSYPPYPGGTSRQRYWRELLRSAMEAEGFSVYEAEWWHFDYRDWRKYRVGNS